MSGHLLRGLLVAGCGLAAACSCQPTLPSTPPDRDTDDSAILDTAPDDTAPPPPCDAPEVEPNDGDGTATELPMEALGCGRWEAPGDVDYFAFDMPETAWIQVFVDAKRLGSVADAKVTVTGADGAGAFRNDDESTTDPTLVIPATPQRYTVRLEEQNGQGDVDRYFYEVMASVTKPPVSWTRFEQEPNDGSLAAETVYSGDVIFGTMGSNFDSDWFEIAVPAGKHTLTVEVLAYAHGSPGDYSLMVYDDAVQPLPLGCNNCITRTPPNSSARDPLLEWSSPGDEVLYFRIFEADSRFGDAVWYAMSVTLEGP